MGNQPGPVGVYAVRGRVVAGGFQSWLRLVLMIAAASPTATAFAVPDGSPEQALVEILTASKAEAVEKHLPESVRAGLRSLSLEDRRACEQKLLVGKNLVPAGGELKIPEDGHALLVQETGDSGLSSELRLEREVIGGGDALLKLTLLESGMVGEKRWSGCGSRTANGV
jgi:hypothetical protein